MYITFLTVVLWHCAAQGPPPGGPVDKTGPTLLSATPPSGARQVDVHSRVVLTFSEPIDPRSANNALTVKPRPEPFPEVEVRGEKLRVKFLAPLQKDKTYIISFGRNLTDYRNNPTPGEIRLAFATGDSLDCGLIRGRVYQIPRKHFAQVRVFRETDGFPDTLLNASPDYVATADNQGDYQVSNLATGKYRLIAIASQNPNPPRITDQDYLGLPQREAIALDHRRDTVTQVNFRVGQLPTEPFRLVKASPEPGRLTIHCSQVVQEASLAHTHWDIYPEEVQIRHQWWRKEDPQKVFLQLRNARPEQEYRLVPRGLKSQYGEELDSTSRVFFIWQAKADTLPPRFLGSRPQQKGQDVALDASVWLDFSEPIIISDPEQDIQLYQLPDSLMVPVQQTWYDDNTYLITPQKPLLSATRYRLALNSWHWQDVYENSFVDSALSISFRTVDVETFGAISGQVTGIADSLLARTFIMAQHSTKTGFIRQVPADSSGRFLIDHLFPGAYRLSVWLDRNQNRNYDPGSIRPYRPAELYRHYPGPVSVRSRWETANVELPF